MRWSAKSRCGLALVAVVLCSCEQSPTHVPVVDAQPPRSAVPPEAAPTAVASSPPSTPPTGAQKVEALVLRSPLNAQALSYLYALSADGTRSYRITLGAADRLCDGSSPPDDRLLPRSIEAQGELAVKWTGKGYRARRYVTDADDRCYELVDLPAGAYWVGMPREDSSVVGVRHPLDDAARVDIVLGGLPNKKLVPLRSGVCNQPAAARVLALMRAELSLTGLPGSALEGCAVTPASCVDVIEQREPTDRCFVELDEDTIRITPRLRSETTPQVAFCVYRTLGTQVESCHVSATTAARVLVNGGLVSFIGQNEHKWFSAADGHPPTFKSIRVGVDHHGDKPLRIKRATLQLEELPDWEWFAGRGTHTALVVAKIEPRVLPLGASTLTVSFSPNVVVPQAYYRAPLRVALELELEGSATVLVHSAYQSTFVGEGGYVGPGLSPFPELDKNNNPTDATTPLLPLQP